MKAQSSHIVEVAPTGFVWEDDHKSSDAMIREILSDGQPRSIRQIEAATGVTYNAAKATLIKLENAGEVESKLSRTTATDGTGNRLVKIYRRKPR